MAQLNLLPDVKMQYISAKRQKRLVIGASALISAVFLIIFIVLLFYVRFSQKHYISALTKDINSTTEQLKQKQDLDKILTIQNQLSSLPALHDQKFISSRLFDYLVQTTPTSVTISDVDLDLDQNIISIKGNADALSTVNKFADTLKFTDFQSTGDNATQDKAFSNVVLQSFTVNTNTSGTQQGQGPITYELNFSYNPIIFSNIKNPGEGVEQDKAVTLKIPNIITTRSETEKPEGLFVPQPDQGGGN